MLLLLPKCFKTILNTLIICLREEPAGHQSAFGPNHISQKQLPRLLVRHKAFTVCVLQNLKRGMSHWSCYAFWAFRTKMGLLLQLAYSLASQLVMCSDGVDAASDPTGVSAPISALLLLPVCVPLAAPSARHQGEQSPPVACSPSTRSSSSRGSWCCGWHGSQLPAQGQRASGPPQAPHSTTRSKGQWPQVLPVVLLERVSHPQPFSFYPSEAQYRVKLNVSGGQVPSGHLAGIGGY